MVNDVSRRIAPLEGNRAQPYSATLVPPEVEAAARNGNTGVVQRYLESGADPNARTVYQSQLLHVAARHGQRDILKLLLTVKGIDISGLDYGGMRRTPLHWACQRNDVESVEALVAAGADITVQGISWSKLVQGQRCGQLVSSTSPPQESPTDLCRTNAIRMALLQPLWTQEIHCKFPPAFQNATRVLVLLASGCSSGGHPAHLEAAVQWPLSLDVTLQVIAAAAYPISAWLQDDM